MYIYRDHKRTINDLDIKKPSCEGISTYCVKKGGFFNTVTVCVKEALKVH